MEKPKLYSLIALAVIIIALSTIMIGDAALYDSKSYTFEDNEGNTLAATYYPGEIQYGILILEGFGSDQTAMRTVTAEMVKTGMHVFSFDFSGHGRSSGYIGFDNAETDRMAKQVIDGLTEFRSQSGLSVSQIFLLGHSLGARVGLQAQTMISEESAGLILLGTQVSLVTNTQSEFFTGVTDNDLEWIQNLGPENPGTNILLASGLWDDILPREAAELLYQKLSGDSSAIGEDGARILVDGSIRELQFFPAVTHSFETYSSRIISASIKWIEYITGMDLGSDQAKSNVLLKITMWIIGIIAILILPVLVAGMYPNQLQEATGSLNNARMDNLGKFFRWKFILWFVSLPAMAIIAAIMVLLPLNSPVFSLTTLGFIAGYGLTNFLLYKIGKFPGVSGKWQRDSDGPRIDLRDRNLQLVLAFALTYFTLTAIYSNTGHSFIYPLNARLIWLGIFTLINAFAYFVGNTELVWFYKRGASASEYRKLLILALMPFFLIIVFYLILNSGSGLQGALLNFLKYGLTLTLGWLVQKKGMNIYVTSILQSFLLQWLILPQGALFKVF